MSMTCLNSKPRRTAPPNLRQLELLFPNAKQPEGGGARKALSIIRSLPTLTAEGREVKCVAPLVVPQDGRSSPKLAASLVERATVGALRRLLHDPLSTQEERIPVQWNSKPALAVVRFR